MRQYIHWASDPFDACAVQPMPKISIMFWIALQAFACEAHPLG